ncbi:FecR domain-containing protein [Caulobacter segnis]|uniref:FecR family protein n=1 Tax=Caulobacter segnis TaxID=88688 RepID=UPI002410B5F9|nr:FecR domain-containing protein [Caulobacter segnis]MDG2520530.1 FecR domain-containing protein [Caulobacter segnis]
MQDVPEANTSRSRSEAALWFAELKNRSISVERVAAFRKWRQDPANRRAYDEIDGLWRSGDALVDDPDMQRLAADVLASTSPSAMARRRRRAAVGAGLLAAAIVLSVGVWRPWQPRLVTKVGESRIAVLSDGSKVTLDTATKIVVDFAGDRRRVTLSRGRAFFDVAHDKTRPFVVEAGNERVEALGTRFEVRKDGDQVQVSLMEGAVKVENLHGDRAQSPVLAPGDQLAATDGAVVRRKVDMQVQTSWRDGKLIFKETPLQAAVGEVNRYSQQKVELADEGLEDVKVSGVFKTGDTAAFASAIATLYRLELEADGRTVRLRPRG